MPTYISLFQKTDEGRKLTVEDAQQRRQTGLELAEEYGVKLEGLYYGLGEYDMITVAEAPNTETIARLQLGYEQEGLAHLQTFEVSGPTSGTLSSRTRSNSDITAWNPTASHTYFRMPSPHH